MDSTKPPATMLRILVLPCALMTALAGCSEGSPTLFEPESSISAMGAPAPTAIDVVVTASCVSIAEQMLPKVVFDISWTRTPGGSAQVRLLTDQFWKAITLQKKSKSTQIVANYDQQVITLEGAGFIKRNGRFTEYRTTFAGGDVDASTREFTHPGCPI